MQSVAKLMIGWPVQLQLSVDRYVVQHRLDVKKFLPVDLVLILLRIGTKEALERATELTGKPITRCPSGMPPWPPKPTMAPPPCSREPVVSRVVENPCPPSTDMHRRFATVRKGLTKEQLIARGCQVRDIRYWQNKGHIEFT